MSELHETKSEIVVLQRIPSHQGLMKVNRWLMAMVFFLMTVIVIAGFFMFPTTDIKNYKKFHILRLNQTSLDLSLSKTTEH